MPQSYTCNAMLKSKKRRCYNFAIENQLCRIHAAQFQNSTFTNTDRQCIQCTRNCCAESSIYCQIHNSTCPMLNCTRQSNHSSYYCNQHVCGMCGATGINTKPHVKYGARLETVDPDYSATNICETCEANSEKPKISIESFPICPICMKTMTVVRLDFPYKRRYYDVSDLYWSCECGEELTDLWDGHNIENIKFDSD